VIDLLHTLFLGPMLHFVKRVVWSLLRLPAFCPSGGNEEERLKVALLKFRACLFAWYDSKAREGVNLTRVSKLTMKMVGTPDRQVLKTKAMETYELLLFVTDQLALYHFDGSARLLEAAELLGRYVSIVKNGPPNLPDVALQERTRITLRHKNARYHATTFGMCSSVVHLL